MRYNVVLFTELVHSLCLRVIDDTDMDFLTLRLRPARQPYSTLRAPRAFDATILLALTVAWVEPSQPPR